MTAFVNANSKYRPLQRRSEKTLIAWWHEINQWGWPKAVQELTGISARKGECTDLRTQVRREIEQELGFRVILLNPS